MNRMNINNIIKASILSSESGFGFVGVDLLFAYFSLAARRFWRCNLNSEELAIENWHRDRF